MCLNRNNLKPLKMLRGTHYGNNYWEVFSKKMNRKACFFSNLEYHNFLTLEMNPKVVQMCEQPLEIEVIIDCKNEKSILDFWIKIPYFHIEKYKRVSNTSGTTSAVGLYELLLAKYPLLDTFIANNYF